MRLRHVTVLVNLTMSMLACLSQIGLPLDEEVIGEQRACGALSWGQKSSEVGRSMFDQTFDEGPRRYASREELKVFAVQRSEK